MEELTELRKEELRISAEILSKLDPKDLPKELGIFSSSATPFQEQMEPTSVMGQRPSTVKEEDDEVR